MGTAMKIALVFLSVLIFTCTAKKIVINTAKMKVFTKRCEALAARLGDIDAKNRCKQGLTELMKVENSRDVADFSGFLDALGYTVPGFSNDTYNPLFWTAFDTQDKNGNPYKTILAENADVLAIWTSFNILPAALMNDKTFSDSKIVPSFLIWPFWQQYSMWMAQHTVNDIPSLWLTGGTDNGYFPEPPVVNGKRQRLSVWEKFELPNIISKRVVVFHLPSKVVAGKRCSNDGESYNHLHDTNKEKEYICCDLPPLYAKGTDTSKGFPRPSVDAGKLLYREMKSALEKIRKESLPDTCVDLAKKFRKDELADEVKGSMSAVVEAAPDLLARMYMYGGAYSERGQLSSLLSAAVCNYFMNKLEDIGGEGRLEFSEEDGNLIGMRSEGVTVRFTELLPSGFKAELLDGLLLNSITYNCSTMKLAISTQIESLTVIPSIVELSRVVLSFSATLGPSKADLSLNTLEISAQWSVGGIAGEFKITDDLDNSQLIVQGGPPGGSDIDLGALIKNLAGSNILGSSFMLSDVRVQALVNMVEGGTITMVVRGRFKQNTLFGIFQKRRDNPNAPYSAAFAAVIDGVEFSKFVKRLTGANISNVPVIGSLSIPKIGVTISTSDIRSPILMDIFSSESLLHMSGSYISSGFTAYFNFSTDQGNIPVFISYRNKNFNFEFLSGSTISFRSLLSLVPDLKSLLDSVALPPGIDNLLDIEINDFSVTSESGAISIDATYPNTLTFFDQLTVDNLNVVVNAVLKSPRSIAVEFSGQIGIAGKVFDVDFSRNEDTGGYVLSVIIVTPLSLNNLLSLIPELSSVDLPPGVSDLLSLQVNTLTSDFSTGAVTVAASYPQPLSFLDGAITLLEGNIIVVAVLKSPRSISIQVTGRVELGEAVFSIDVHRDSQTGKYVIDAESDGPVPLLSLLSLIPDLGSLSLPPGVSDILKLTINDFSVDLDSGALDIVVAYPKTLGFLENSITVKGITITINAIVKSPRRVSVTVSGQIGIGRVVFEIVFSKNVDTGKYGIDATIDKDITLNSLLSLIPELSSLPLPPGLSDLLNLQVEGFSVDIDKRELAVDAKYPGSLTIFDIVTVNNPGVVIHAVFKRPKSVSLELVGDIEISGQDVSISITRDDASGKYVLVADIGRIDIAAIVQEFGAAVVPDELSSVVEAAGFLRFAIDDAHLTYPFGVRPQQIQISGQPEIAGLSVPRMSAIVIRQGGKNKVVQGFEIGSVTISSLIQKISGQSVSSIAILNQELEAAVLISPVTLPGVRLIGSKLSGFSINQGLSFQAAMRWPPGCSDDAFCAVAQSALGPDARFMLAGTIRNARSFTFSASLSDVRLGSVVLTEAGLEVTVGNQAEVGIFGSITIPNPALTLTGAIRVGTRGVVLEMTMSGCWERAFGADWLTICSLQISVSLKPGVPLAGFAFGGEVRLGDLSCGNQIKAQGFIGIDPVSPQENYYYVNIPGKFTIGSILQAFCVSVKLPRPVADSGFPRGFLSSFSLLGKELPHVPLSIPLGYRMSGTINILGLEASADITVGLPKGLKMEVSLPALNLAGDLLTMTASSRDRSRGPYLIVDITLLPRPSINIEASGYLSVLKISREATLRITNDAYMFTIKGKFLNLFEAYLEITASYGDINKASFRVRGGFKNDLFSRIAEKVENAMKRSSSEATAAINSAQRDVDNAKAKFNDANREISGAQRKVDSAQHDFDSAVRSLRGAQNDVRGLCTPPRCGHVCVPAPCGSRCVKRWWGRCVFRLPTFSSCCFKSPNLICEARRAGCIALRATIIAALKVAEEIVDKSRFTLNAAKGILEGAKGVVSAASHTLKVANFALEAAKQTYKAGVVAASALTRFALNDLFNIKEMTFDVQLSVANGGSFSGRVKARILGNNVNVALRINVRDVTSMARQLAEEAIDGLSSFFG